MTEKQIASTLEEIAALDDVANYYTSDDAAESFVDELAHFGELDQEQETFVYEWAERWFASNR